MSETLSQIIAKMGTPAKPTGSTPKVPKEPKVPKVVQKARQTAVKRSPNPFVQAVEQAFKPTTPTKPQEPNLGQIIKQFKDVASSGRKQRGETLMQEYIRNTQPVSGNMGFKAGSGKGATIEAEMAAYDRKTFGAETYGKRPKGVSTAEWSKRQSHKGKFKQLAGTRNEQVAELDREIEAYKLENMTPVQRLELARETTGGLPGFYDKERASALAASLMGSQDLKDKTDASLFIRAANQVMQPVSTAYTVAMKDPRSLAEMPVGLQVGLSAGDLGAQIVGGFLTGGGSTPATASTLARIGAVATRSLALDAPGYIQMIEDAGGVDKALVAYKDMIGKALDPNSKISASERVNGIALAGMIVLSGGGKIAGKGAKPTPDLPTKPLDVEAPPVRLDLDPVAPPKPDFDPVADAYSKWQGMDGEEVPSPKPKAKGGKWETQITHRDYSNGENLMEAVARSGGKVIGRVDYSDFKGEIIIKHVEVDPEWRRKGVATSLYDKIKAENPGATLETFGTRTDEGAAFRKTYDASNTTQVQKAPEMTVPSNARQINAPSPKIAGQTEAVPPSVESVRGQVGGVGLDAQPPLRPGGKEPVAGVEPEKDSRLKDLVEGFDEPEVEPLSDREKVRAAGGAVRMRAYHGTSHTVDQFTTNAIGTGEGNQAQGWGLYFAGNKDVAEFYRETVSYSTIRKQFLDALPEDADFADVIDLLGSGHFSAYQERVIKALQADDWLGFDYPSQAISAAYRDLKNFEASPELLRAVEESGNLYEVDIPDAADLLDWDAPLSKQPKAVLVKLEQAGLYSKPKLPTDSEIVDVVRGALRKGKPENVEVIVDNDHDLHVRATEIMIRRGVDIEEVSPGEFIYSQAKDYLEALSETGESLYRRLTIDGNQEVASRTLQDAGLPGLRYLDGASRDLGEGFHNYVIWDESVIAKPALDGQPPPGQIPTEAQPTKPSQKKAGVSSSKQVEMEAAELLRISEERKAAGTSSRVPDVKGRDSGTAKDGQTPDRKSGSSPEQELSKVEQARANLQEAVDDWKKETGGQLGSGLGAFNPRQVEKTVKVIQRLGELGVAHVEEAIRQFSEAIGRKLSKPEEAHFRKLWDENQAKPKAEGEPEVPEAATGLARQFTDQERFARELEETKTPAQSVQKLVDATQAEWGDGGHIKAELALRRGNEPGFNPTRDQIVKDTAMVAHLKREVKNEYDRLLRKDDPTPQDMADIQAVEAKLNEIDEYAQKIRTHWHDVGMALQIAYKPDFTVADLTMRARAANGGDISPDAQKQINDWVSKYEAAQKELDELRKAKPPKEVSGVAVSKPRAARATAFNRLANLGLEVLGEDGNVVRPTKGGGMKGGKQAGAVAIPKLTPSMENELRKSIRQIAKAYIVDEHPIAGSLDGVVTLVRKHLPSLSEEDILRYLSDRYHRVLLDSDLQRRESQAFMRRIQAAADYRNKTLLEKGFAQAGALLNTTQRGLQASMDLSAPFRQGRRVMVTKEWVNAWLPSTKAMFAKDPQKAMELHSAELARSPYYSKGVESGLGISSASKPEEVWAGRLLQDWAAGKGLAAGKANPLRAYANLIQRSEAHYTIFLNDLRMRLFENLAKRNPNDKEYLESIAQMINVMTGRGHGKTATMLSHPAAGNVFYAPRYAWSEVQSTGMVPIWKTKSKMARQEAIKAYGRNFAVTVVGLSLARLFGNEVELDPRGTDFLKVRLQNGKVVDVLGASQQYLRLLVRMGYGSVSRKGFYSEPGAFGADPLMQAVNNKLSPAARSLLGLLRGWASPNADGDWQKQPPGMVLRDSVTPMGARKTGDQMWSDGDKWALLNLLGIDYEKGQPNKRQKKGSRPPKLEGLPQGMRQFAGHAPITGR